MRSGAGRGGEGRGVPAGARLGQAGGAQAPALWRQHWKDRRPADCSRELSVGEMAAVGSGLGRGRCSDGKGARTGQRQEELEGSELGKRPRRARPSS